MKSFRLHLLWAQPSRHLSPVSTPLVFLHQKFLRLHCLARMNFQRLPAFSVNLTALRFLDDYFRELSL